MTRDKLLSEARKARAGWPAALFLWALLLAAMILSGLWITSR